MIPTKLTDAEEQTLEKIKRVPDAILRRHKSHSGSSCHRLLDGNFNPIENLAEKIVTELINKGK